MPKILVVDNDYAFAEFAQLLLESKGYQVVVALNGKDALELAASEKPDLILMDIVMPEMNGIEAVKRLKAEPSTEKIPVIFCSMSKNESEINDAMSCGAVDHLQKPLKREELTRRIGKIMERGR